ncbi:hypothetical protein AOLI_G00007130 [Acnodon oligacanthus]
MRSLSPSLDLPLGAIQDIRLNTVLRGCVCRPEFKAAQLYQHAAPRTYADRSPPRVMLGCQVMTVTAETSKVEKCTYRTEQVAHREPRTRKVTETRFLQLVDEKSSA